MTACDPNVHALPAHSQTANRNLVGNTCLAVCSRMLVYVCVCRDEGLMGNKPNNGAVAMVIMSWRKVGSENANKRKPALEGFEGFRCVLTINAEEKVVQTGGTREKE